MNTETVLTSLEKHFQAIDKIILSRQDAITGLLPASTAVNAHGDYTDAWVRDNVYSIMSVWGLGLSYKKFYPEHHRTYLLSQSVVKLMRGLLNAMMRQSDRIEAYKKTNNPTDALHAKYGTSTGLAVVGDDEWGHLQLDATSIFILMIAQMTASGLRLIYTMDEVNFVQNLVHYISRTYCTPDYGIWERGNKINHGTTEINCSSVGMAKAALEAINGFNLFGNVISNEAVIHVVANDIARSRFTLHSLLPRESNSKETDAALLSIIGYPAYAVEDETILKYTRDKIIKKLAGNYGCKRFLLDGHQSSIEDENRLHYEPSELREFEHIESEWPLFFTYLLLDALMREDKEEIQKYKEKLEPLFVEENGIRLLPELYIVPKELIEAEKENPGSQKRIANENLPLVWAQSLYMLCDMIMEGILDTSDIDPLHRRKRIGHKRSTYPMVAVLAENKTVQEKLLSLGINSQTLEDVKPIRVSHACELSEIHTYLGKNEKLSLTGRPLLVTRTITTARMHLLQGQKTVFLPYYFNPQGFYFSYDNILLAEHFRASLTFLTKHWDQPGQPIVPFLVREGMLSHKTQEFVLELLRDLQNGQSDGVKVLTAPLEQLLSTADMERIDNLYGYTLKDIQLDALKQRSCIASESANNTRPLSPQELYDIENEKEVFLTDLLFSSENRCQKAHALSLLYKRHGGDYKIFWQEEEFTLAFIAKQHYEMASQCHDWAVARRLADMSGKFDDRLEDVLLDIIISQKRLAVGRAYSEKATFSKPHDSHLIVNTIKEFCGNNVAEGVLTQEIILHLGHLIRIEPELFSNIITLRTWYFVQLLVGQISRERELSIGDAYEILLGFAPHDIYNRLRTILQSFTKEVKELRQLEHLSGSGIENFEQIQAQHKETKDFQTDDWALWREHSGMISGLPRTFYKDIWHLLHQCKGLVIGDKYNIQSRIGSETTYESTAGERNFELRIDSLLQSIDAPDYRQLNIELIEALAKIFRQTPELKIDNDIILDVLIGYAVRIAWNSHNESANYDEQKAQAWENFYKLSPQETEKNFVDAFVYLLTSQES
ncbi:glycoside hydrolase family 15 protein [bacterium]|nr:glycoside hydrolase family 15 protein [bacterium]MBU1435316.1 glycoside hydrolase family 15 protein [bacterium]MBU1503514.1 glycoside hydrolase family 15 protein [bacterium]